jgi:hypothetical protein
MRMHSMTHDSDRSVKPLPTYEPPKITLMDEKSILEAFQIQTAASSWWA